MIGIADLIQPADIYLGVPLETKKDVLRFLAERVSAKCGSRPEECRHALAAREKLGSTAIGAGIAFPHAQLEGLTQPMAIFVRPEVPVAFAAADEGPVDLILMLLSPVGDTRAHLEGLASLAKVLRAPDMVKTLRQAESTQDVVDAFIHPH
jgi:PTS system nitrogen regulatory IIA component